MSRKSTGENQLHTIFQTSFQRRKGLTGPGHDCASIRPPKGSTIYQTCDQLVEGVHVEAGTSPEIQAGKLLGRTLSDLAAAGATPWAVSWCVAVPPERPMAWMRSLSRAFLHHAQKYKVSVIGGDFSTSAPRGTLPAGLGAVLSCTAQGLSNRPAPGRSGARPGDRILVTGQLGGAVSSGRHLHPTPRLREGKRLVEHYAPHAMMDLSDGLAQDLPRLLEASQVGAVIDLAALPLSPGICADRSGWQQAMGEGEDYELMVILAPQTAARVLRDRLLGKVGLTEIGQVVDGRTLQYQKGGRVMRLKAQGWQHGWGHSA
jgi:thiamine-monophosphate kinase